MLTPIILFATLLLFMLLGLPIAWSLGLSCVAALTTMDSMPLMLLSQRCFHACNNITFLAVPAFCIAGEVMSEGGISRRLIELATVILGRIRGSLAMVSIASCALFAAMTGSANATTMAIGSIMYPEMVKKDYDPDFSAAVQAVGGTLGPVIPPSTMMIFYGVATSTSISKLLISGVIPGVICAVAMCVYCFFACKKQGAFVTEEKFSAKKLWTAFRDSILALLMPIIILGSIYLGICTATESATFAAVYGIIIAMFVYRSIKPKDLLRIARKAVISTANVTIMVITAQLFGWIVTYYNIPSMLAQSIMHISSSPMMFLFLSLIILLIAGMFMEALSVIVIMAPILAPVASFYGIDPIFFGFFMVFVMCIGIASPPFGPCLFMTCSITGRPFVGVAKRAIPLLGVEVLVAVVCMFLPQLVTFLPNLMK